jgi:DNA-binding IclR family transcriptional regulator
VRQVRQVLPAEPTSGAQAVDRALLLFRMVAAAETPPTLTQLSVRSALPMSTVSRLMLALTRHDLITRDESGYTLTTTLQEARDVR